MYSIGVDIGGMSIKIGVVSEDGVILHHTTLRTNPQDGWKKMIADICDKIKLLLKENLLTRSSIRGIGIGVPGIADNDTGIVSVAINLGWKNVPLAKEVFEHLGLPVALSNDANCAALAEQRFGVGKGIKNLVMLTLGTGIGGGIIVNGNLIESAGGAGGECGHIIIHHGGEQCNCGAKGCFERYASASALIKQTKAAMEADPSSIMHKLAIEEGKVSGRTAFNAAKMGDKTAQAVIDQYIEYLAAGIISLGNILHPQTFVLGGGISNEGEALIKPLIKKLDEYIERSGLYPKYDILIATLGNEAGVIGACALV